LRSQAIRSQQYAAAANRVILLDAQTQEGKDMQVGRVDVNKLRGVGDKAFGLTKEFVGVLVGNDELQQEGEAQQERATEELKALRKEMDAQRKEAVAEAHEQRQKTAQKAKSA